MSPAPRQEEIKAIDTGNMACSQVDWHRLCFPPEQAHGGKRHRYWNAGPKLPVDKESRQYFRSYKASIHDSADDNGALFAVSVTNSVGSVVSNNATLTVE